jgi:hypothetical protein
MAHGLNWGKATRKSKCYTQGTVDTRSGLGDFLRRKELRKWKKKMDKRARRKERKAKKAQQEAAKIERRRVKQKRFEAIANGDRINWDRLDNF